ncbi:5-formyltetrahydrofolate cyclo-ligase [Fredinandcohnia sp. 179-A 10B2 NHS]|uniref:5-formyltetrahydrofolate cyclo-ligase n=1 Tax=Fredinandcohnia sp. 179-A 10B2 NHS TaxID=3235176 RepID=UPI0039A14986
MKTKQELRKEMKQTLLSIHSDTFASWSETITKHVIHLPEWQNAQTIGVTISGDYEVNTEGLIKHAWENNKRVVVPKCHPKTKDMTFREIKSFEQLEVVYFGLKEPIEEQTTSVDQSQIDLVIVPGLYFTKRGYRLGHGGGYYDRYLSSYNGQTISLAFPMQIVESLPIEEFDVPVQKLVTPSQVITCDD